MRGANSLADSLLPVLFMLLILRLPVQPPPQYAVLFFPERPAQEEAPPVGKGENPTTGALLP